MPVADTGAVARRGTDAVIAYLGPQAAGSVADGHVGVAGAGVLEHVGQAFLNDAIGGKVEGRGERERLALDMQPDGQAGPADLFQQ
jgi:hypothetical protein